MAISSAVQKQVGQNTNKPKTKRQQLATDLCDFYNARLRIAASRFSTTILALKPYDRLSKPQKLTFLQAAAACKGCKAEPKKFVMAQFETFMTYARHSKKPRYFPLPCHLTGPGAQIRFIEYQQMKHDTNIQAAQKPKQQKQFWREERKLRGLVRIYRKPESDVLVDHPCEFTQEFLEMRGVWSVVRDTYEADHL